MKIHAFSLKYNNIVCGSSQGNGSSIPVNEFLLKNNEMCLCKKCMKRIKKLHIKY